MEDINEIRLYAIQMADIVHAQEVERIREERKARQQDKPMGGARGLARPTRKSKAKPKDE